MAEALSAGIAGSRLIGVSPAAHLLATERPERACEIVRDAIRMEPAASERLDPGL